MQTREILLLAGSAVLLAAVGIVAFGEGAVPVAGAELEREAEPEAPTPPLDPPTAPTPPDATAALPTTTPESERALPSADLTKPQHDRTDGRITGTIAIGSQVAPGLDSVTVQITEAINLGGDGQSRPPFRTERAYAIRGTTPEYAFDGIPFSPYGYHVRALAPGFNGSEVWVQIDAGRPVHDGATLSVTRGTPFSLLLRDQQRSPVAGQEVRMVPIGEPFRPPVPVRKSDSFGSVVFEELLAGRWQVLVGEAGATRNAPTEIDVLPTAGVQSKTVLVPTGMPLRVRVTTHGYGVPAAKLTATQTDTTQYRPIEGETDQNGDLVLEHLPPGSWQIHVEAEGFHRTTRSLTIKDGVQPDVLEVKVMRR